MYCIRKDVSSISVLTRNGNVSYGTEERQRNGGNQELRDLYLYRRPHNVTTSHLIIPTASHYRTGYTTAVKTRLRDTDVRQPWRVTHHQLHPSIHPSVPGNQRPLSSSSSSCAAEPMFYGASDPKPVESSSIRLAGPSVCRRGGVKPRYMMAIDRGGANVRGLTGTDHPLYNAVFVATHSRTFTAESTCGVTVGITLQN